MKKSSSLRLSHYLIVLIIGLVSATADSFVQTTYTLSKLGSLNHNLVKNKQVSSMRSKTANRRKVVGSFSSFNDEKVNKPVDQQLLVSRASIDDDNLPSTNQRFQHVSRLTRVVSLPTLLIGTLVLHKCGTDMLSHYTRTHGEPYSATTVSVLGELIKVPILLLAIASFEGVKRVGPILKEATTEGPFLLMLPGLAYSAQNVLYFMALSRISAPSYQILSQSKLLFTGYFMSGLLGNKLGKKQVGALLLLTLGTILTQLSEMSQTSLGGTTTSDALIGGAITVLGAALSSLPNVFYEKVLKEDGQNQWVRNVQITFWIWFWLVTFTLPDCYQAFRPFFHRLFSSPTEKATLTAVAAAATNGILTGTKGTNLLLKIGQSSVLKGIDKWVVGVMLLQGLKCLIIPATLKYADNIAYSYAKPASILLTSLVSILVSGILPSVFFVMGASAVMASMWLYSSK